MPGPGQCLDTARTMLGQCPDSARTGPGQCLDSARTVPGQGPNNAWTMPGQSRVSVGTVPGQCLDNARVFYFIGLGMGEGGGRTNVSRCGFQDECKPVRNYSKQTLCVKYILKLIQIIIRERQIGSGQMVSAESPKMQLSTPRIQKQQKA